MEIRQYFDSRNPALILHPSGRTVGFAELEEVANRLAHYLRGQGLHTGDVIAVVMENNEHLHGVMWAARRAGLYYVLVNTHLSAAEAAYVVADSGAAAVIGSHAMRDLCDGISAELGDRMPAIKLTTSADHVGWEVYPACVADRPATPIADESEGELLQYSSGTTGKPKGIIRPLTGLAPADVPPVLAPLLAKIDLTGESVYLNPAPLYHTAPAYWSMSVQALGGTVVIMERFDPENALSAIARYRVTHGQFVPAMFVRMLKLPGAVRDSYDVSSLRRVVHAAAPCPVDIKKRMIDWLGPMVDEFYSCSEGIGTTFITAEEWLAKPGSVGRPITGEPHVLDDDGNEVPPGRVGDIYFDGGLPFSYHNDAAKTEAARAGNGWFTVGDMGYLDDDGYLYLTDRRHHMIISGGVNIYPQELEAALIGHPDVMDAAVFGIPDDEMGQSVKAVVQLVDPSTADADTASALLSWLRDRVAHYKCPRSISFETQLPRTDAGKLYKQTLVDRYSKPG